MSEETVHAGTHYGKLCTLVRLAVLQGRVGAHKIGVVRNTIHVLLQVYRAYKVCKLVPQG